MHTYNLFLILIFNHSKFILNKYHHFKFVIFYEYSYTIQSLNYKINVQSESTRNAAHIL